MSMLTWPTGFIFKNNISYGLGSTRQKVENQRISEMGTMSNFFITNIGEVIVAR